MAYFRCIGGNGGGGGAGKKAALVLEAYSTESQDNTMPRTQWDRNAYDTGYFSYSAASHKWTVSKNFTALVILVINQNRDASTSNSFSLATVNRNLQTGYNFDALALGTATPDRYANSYGIEYAFIKLKTGDQIAEGKPVGLGWENPYFYILETEDDKAVSVLENGQNITFTTGATGYQILQNYFNFA